MSATRQTTLWCDAPDCVEWTQHDTGNTNEARAEARSAGWIARKGRDYCPTDAAAIKTGPPKVER